MSIWRKMSAKQTRALGYKVDTTGLLRNSREAAERMCRQDGDEALAKNTLRQKAYNAKTLEELREVVVGLADRVLT